MATKKRRPTREAKEETLLRQLIAATVDTQNTDEGLKLTKREKAEVVEAVFDLFSESLLMMIESAVIGASSGEAETDDDDEEEDEDEDED